MLFSTLQPIVGEHALIIADLRQKIAGFQLLEKAKWQTRANASNPRCLLSNIVNVPRCLTKVNNVVPLGKVSLRHFKTGS